jgi:hypothetical protein
MNKIWICPKCKSPSTRRSNLKAHIRNCHPGEQHEPMAYDPLIREVILNWSPRIMHQVPPITASQLTYTDQRDSQSKQGRNLLAEHTKFLNVLSDYGDALKRFNNHVSNPVEPAVLFSLLLSNQGQPAKITLELG